MLQVLVSIQGLVLKAKPYYNEPSNSWIANTRWGRRRSFVYNETAFLLSCTTMLYIMRKPPKNFEKFVTNHFREHGGTILAACKAYLCDAEIGSSVEERGGQYAVGTAHSEDFKAKLRGLFELLLKNFTAIGADCQEFLAQKNVQAPAACKEVLAQEGTSGDASGAPRKAACSSNKSCSLKATAESAPVSSTATAAQKARSKDASAAHKPSSSLLNIISQYLLKLGKKVLPVEEK